VVSQHRGCQAPTLLVAGLCLCSADDSGPLRRARTAEKSLLYTETSAHKNDGPEEPAALPFLLLSCARSHPPN
jgi:hypothetical protein